MIKFFIFSDFLSYFEEKHKSQERDFEQMKLIIKKGQSSMAVIGILNKKCINGQ